MVKIYIEQFRISEAKELIELVHQEDTLSKYQYKFFEFHNNTVIQITLALTTE